MHDPHTTACPACCLQENVRGMRQECTERWVSGNDIAWHHPLPASHPTRLYVTLPVARPCPSLFSRYLSFDVFLGAAQVTEQAALGQVAGLKDTIAGLEAAVTSHSARVRQLEASLDTQLGINKQLMSKKEEVEWQLMAAMAKVGGC